MIHEHFFAIKNKSESYLSESSNQDEKIMKSKVAGIDNEKSLLDLGFQTASGVHDSGWNKFGYWFGTQYL